MLVAHTVAGSEGVILLHGLARTAGSMTKLEAELRAAGYVVLNVDYPSREARIEDLSERVISKAIVAPELCDCETVHFVTHSMGGILVRAYMERHSFPQLGRVVMLGPPNQGSEVVDRLRTWSLFRRINGPAGQELGTDMQSVPNRLGPVRFELGVIAGDRSINWINSLMIKGADDGKVSVQKTKVKGMKEHLVLHVMHPTMMRDRRVINAVLQFLKTGSFGVRPADNHAPQTPSKATSGSAEGGV
ncbi:alpha/beta hydrolase [Opitutaceae bacterium EW11]|nr:alpha/beta hydrolase [Opitutaceae bacterium EW11]